MSWEEVRGVEIVSNSYIYNTNVFYAVKHVVDYKFGLFVGIKGCVGFFGGKFDVEGKCVRFQGWH